MAEQAKCRCGRWTVLPTGAEPPWRDKPLAVPLWVDLHHEREWEPEEEDEEFYCETCGTRLNPDGTETPMVPAAALEFLADACAEKTRTQLLEIVGTIGNPDTGAVTVEYWVEHALAAAGAEPVPLVDGWHDSEESDKVNKHGDCLYDSEGRRWQPQAEAECTQRDAERYRALRDGLGDGDGMGPLQAVEWDEEDEDGDSVRLYGFATPGTRAMGSSLDDFADTLRKEYSTLPPVAGHAALEWLAQIISIAERDSKPAMAPGVQDITDPRQWVAAALAAAGGRRGE